MIDLGKSLYENRNHYFNQLNVCRIIVNPEIKGYPPIFLICQDKQGHQPVEYVVAVNFTQMNQILMHVKSTEKRMSIAEELAHSLIPRPKTHEFSLRKQFGKPLRITGLKICTTLKKFVTEPQDDEDILYFFEWSGK